MDNQISKFLEIFKQLHINIYLIEILEHMPKYANFFKKIMSNKRKWEDHKMIMLTEWCSAILQKKLPTKLKDPERFNIPCKISNFFFDKPLCDLVAIINMMHFSIFRKLGLGELKPITISLQLANTSKRPNWRYVGQSWHRGGWGDSFDLWENFH